jgi:ornithine cyclodeaminase/alanine dehydrogenase-like protein (mu-crystallin family)
MAIFLRESEIEQLGTMKMALEAVEEAFRLQGEQKAEIAPRRRCHVGGGSLNVLSASLPTLGLAGLKSYSVAGSEARFHVLLYGEDGRMLAVMEANRLGQLRTGAASAVATKYMARKEASRLGIIGTGLQAKSQVEAICLVRPIKTVTAYSPNQEHRENFCKQLTEKLGVGVYPAASAEEAVKEMDIVVTATSAKEPVLQGAWLSKGTHLNAIGSNYLSKRELDVETVRKCACVVVDSAEQSRLEAGDLARASEEEAFFWEDIRELGLVVVGEYPGREDDSEITLFKSLGIALEDVAFAGKIYEAAKKAGIGQALPF